MTAEEPFVKCPKCFGGNVEPRGDNWFCRDCDESFEAAGAQLPEPTKPAPTAEIKAPEKPIITPEAEIQKEIDKAFVEKDLGRISDLIEQAKKLPESKAQKKLVSVSNIAKFEIPPGRPCWFLIPWGMTSL